MHEFETKLAREWPPEKWTNTTVVVAVSGGADSIALLRGVLAIRLSGLGRVLVAHVNHRLRGTQADADAAFVEELARRFGLPYESVVCPLNLPDHTTGVGLEAAARQARYDILEEVAAESGARYVVTAHTADDQTETILHRIIRGTGPRGLSGIPRARQLGPAVLLRPLLTISRQCVLEYLEAIGQPYRHDHTNDELTFTRNRIRRDLLPTLREQYNSQVDAALRHLGELATEQRRAIRWMVDRLSEECLEKADSRELVISTRPLKNVPGYLVRECLQAIWQQQRWPLRDMTQAHWRQLEAMVLGRSDQPPKPARKGSPATDLHPPHQLQRRVLPGNIHAECETERLVLTRK